MANGNNAQTSGGKSFLSDYRSQFIFLGVIVAAVLVIRQIFSPLWQDHWVLILVNAAALGFLTLLSFWKRFWRDYRWLAGSGVLILLVLIDFSWGKSVLGVNALERRQSVEYVFSQSGAVLQVEYPEKIRYDGENTGSLVLLLTTSAPCPPASIIIYSSDLLFAIPTSNDTSPQWTKALTVPLQKDGKTLALLIRPALPAQDFTKKASLTIQSPHTELTLQSAAPPAIKLEGSQEAQRRLWADNLMDTGGIIVSLIIAVFAGIKQLESERKSQRTSEIKQAIDDFNIGVKNDISRALEKNLKLLGDWNEWDKTLQDQFRDQYATFVEKDLWEAIANKTLEEVKEDVQRLLQICERIFEDKESKPISIVKQLQKALENDAQELLTMLKEYPESVDVAKQIAGNFSTDLKKKTVLEYAKEFSDQIRDLRVELDFPDTESFPLQEQFAYHAKDHTPEEKLTAWLKAHELDYSPFADTDSPFFSFDKKLFIELATPRFAFPEFRFQNASFEFATSWDAGAALFEYCKLLQKNIPFKDAAFFVLINPGLLENHEAAHPQKLYLHALAEQWILTLSENPTLFYSLKGAQRDLTGRLLRWHDLSPSITANKITEKLQGRREDQIAKVLPGKIRGWLEEMNATDLRLEEINALIGLRPLPKQYTLFLISTIDLNPLVERQISPSLQEALGRQSDWLNVHNCGFVRFLVGSKNRQIVSDDSLVSQCNARVRNSSKSKTVVFNQLFDAPGEDPDAILARKAAGSPGKMVRLGQKLLLQHVEKYPPDEPLDIEDLLTLA